MRSRSASRTRWVSTCFAVCTALRPNSSIGSSSVTSPPTSASSSISRASSSVSSRSSSSTSLTTFQTRRTSRLPFCSSRWTRISASWPSLRRAAEARLSLIVSTSVFLSTRFSRMICANASMKPVFITLSLPFQVGHRILEQTPRTVKIFSPNRLFPTGASTSRRHRPRRGGKRRGCRPRGRSPSSPPPGGRRRRRRRRRSPR